MRGVDPRGGLLKMKLDQNIVRGKNAGSGGIRDRIRCTDLVH